MTGSIRRRTSLDDSAHSVLPDELAHHVSKEARNHFETLHDVPRNERFLMVLVGNGALVEMILNWLCNTQHMTDVHRRTLILMTDRVGYTGLVKNKHGVRVDDCSLNDSSLEADMSFATEAYWRMTERRVRILGVLLRSGISFLNVEADAIWARNPLVDPRLVSSPRDIVLSVEMTTEIEFIFAFGFMLMRSNERTLALYSELEKVMSASIANMTSRQHGPGDFVYAKELQEQELLKRLVQSNVYQVTYSCLDQCSYASGRWYAKKDLRKYCKDAVGVPRVINNNWIVGNKEKAERAKLWGHWFLDGNQECKQSSKEMWKGVYETFAQLEPPSLRM